MQKCPLNIVVASPLGPGGKGGMDRVMDGITQELLRRHSTVRMTSYATRGSGPKIEMVPKMLRFATRMVALKLIGRCDVVHINVASHGSAYRKMIVARLAALLGIPYVVHLHGGLFRDFYDELSDKWKKRMKRFFGNAASVVTLGEYWRNFVCEAELAPSERVVVLPNGSAVRPQANGGVDGVVNIVFLGILSEKKGILQLLSALERLRDQGGWRAVLAGTDKISAQEKVVELGLSSKVSIPGWLSPSKTDELLASSDILVLPSFIENLPMCVVEGMASGLAVIATPVGAVSEIVRHGETGLLVPPGDVDALSKAIDVLLGDSSLRKRLGENARELHNEKLNIEKIVTNLCEVWSDAAKELR